MINKLLTVGEGAFCDHELLEILLFFSLPRVNTNTYAHELITRFGSLEGVFNSSIDELSEIKGIGQNSSTLIKTVGGIIKRSQTPKKSNKKRKMNSLTNITDHILSLFDGEKEEKLYMIALDNSLDMIDSICILSGAVNYSSGTVAEIIRSAVRLSAANVILAHNHPHGIAIPSTTDFEATCKINEGLRFVNVNLVDHFVVSQNRINRIMQSGNSDGVLSGQTKAEQVTK